MVGRLTLKAKVLPMRELPNPPFLIDDPVLVAWRGSDDPETGEPFLLARRECDQPWSLLEEGTTALAFCASEEDWELKPDDSLVLDAESESGEALHVWSPGEHPDHHPPWTLAGVLGSSFDDWTLIEGWEPLAEEVMAAQSAEADIDEMAVRVNARVLAHARSIVDREVKAGRPVPAAAASVIEQFAPLMGEGVEQ